MQTNFTLAQLADPRTAASEKILRSCVHCGFCTATCPTYVLLGDELDSPRGRIYLIKDMLEQGKAATPEVVTHIDRCLSCLSCMTTCPSGVHYMHLVDHARAHIEKTHGRAWTDRALRYALASILPYPWRFRVALAAASVGRAALDLLPAPRRASDAPPRAPRASLGGRLRAMLALAPRRPPRPPSNEARNVFPAEGARRARVALLEGCAQSVLDPGVNAATVRLLNRLGVEVVLAKGEACCGALTHHMGRETQSHAQAANNIDAWTREIDGEGLDAIVITASGCGTTIKDYGYMFRDDAAYAAKAARVSALAKDVTELLDDLQPQPVRATELVVAYHSACSMQHGQKITEAPKRLLRAAGFRVKDVPEGHLCCGSAGVYNILQPEIARRLRDRKVGHLSRLKADAIATGNIGCITQIRAGLDEAGETTPILHTVELLDWATGGPFPDKLRAAGIAEDRRPAGVAAE